MPPIISPIVEGHGEREAVPLLVMRIAGLQAVYPLVNPPVRVKVGSFLNDTDYFTRYVTLAAAKVAQSTSGGFVIILLDCEDNCPGTLGPDLLARARAVRSDIDYLVFLAYREYETWFLAAAESLRGLSGLPVDLEPPLTPESLRDAKGWLGGKMPGGYDPLEHQASFTKQMDLVAAQKIPSFRRLYEKLTTQLSRFQEHP